MSRFYASIRGGRNPKTCQGHKTTGICGHIRGWDKGFMVEGFVDAEGNDKFIVYETGGSRNPFGKKVLAEI